MTINPYPVFLAQGLVKYVSGLSPAISPIATLAAATNVGDTKILLNGVASSAFIQDAVIHFLDEIGEKKVVVQSIDTTVTPAVVTLDFSGRTNTGLLVAHAQNTQVVTNLFRTYLGDRINDTLSNGYPIIGLWVQNNAKRWVNTGQWQNQAIASVLYRLSGKQPDGPKLHSQIWLEETLDRAENDTEILVEGLEKNSTIRVAGTSYAFLVTNFITARRDNLADPQNPVFEFLIDIHVQGLFETAR